MICENSRYHVLLDIDNGARGLRLTRRCEYSIVRERKKYRRASYCRKETPTPTPHPCNQYFISVRKYRNRFTHNRLKGIISQWRDPRNQYSISVVFTETKMSSFWRNFHHWLHWKLSFWQLSVQPVMKISSKWRHFRFSVTRNADGCQRDVILGKIDMR